jgi:hypothetical protein
MMVLLSINVPDQCVFLTHPEGKRPIPILPGKIRRNPFSGFDPLAGRGFEFLHQIRDGKRTAQSDSQMHMVLHAADAVGLAITFPGHTGKKRVGFRPMGFANPRGSVFGAENDMYQNTGVGLGHEHSRKRHRQKEKPKMAKEKMYIGLRRSFRPRQNLCPPFQGLQPWLVCARTVGAEIPALGVGVPTYYGL